MQILTSVRNERSLHRAERADPTTRSWTPPRTFLAQVRFLRPGEKPPRPGSPAPPSGPENAGQKGQKSRPPGRPESRPAEHPAQDLQPPMEHADGVRRYREDGPVRTRTPGQRGLPHAQARQGEKRGPGEPAVRRPASGGRIEQPAASAAGGALQRVLRPVDEDVVGGVPARGPAGRPAFHQPRRDRDVPHRETALPGSPETGPHGPGSTTTGRQPAPHSSGMELMTK